MYTRKSEKTGDGPPQKKIAHIAPVKINPQPGPSETESAKGKMTISDMSESERLKKRAERFSAHLSKNTTPEDQGIEYVKTRAQKRQRKRKADTDYRLSSPEREDVERAENILSKVEDRIRQRKERERERERRKENIIITVNTARRNEAAVRGDVQGRSHRDRDDHRSRDSARRRADDLDLDYHSSKRPSEDRNIDRYRDRSYGRNSPNTSPGRHSPFTRGVYTGTDDRIHMDPLDLYRNPTSDRIHMDPLDLYRNPTSDRIHMDPPDFYGDRPDDRIHMDPLDPYRDQPGDQIHMDPLDSYSIRLDDSIHMDPADPFRDQPHNWIHTGLRDYDDTRDSNPRGSVDEQICVDPDSYRDTINSQLRCERDMSANYQDSRSRFYPHDTNRKQLDTHLRPDSLSQYGDSREERHSLDPQASCRTLSDDQLSLGPQQAYRDEPEDRHLTSLYRDEIITPYIAPGEERCTFDRYPDVAPDRPDYRVDPDLSIYPEGSPVQMTEHLMRGRTYGNTQQYNPQPANIDSQVFDYDHGGLETVQNPSRDRFKRIQDSRYSSDRVQDPGHVSDRSQDYSRHSSDRVHDFSGRGSDRVQDSSSFCSEKMENSRHLSDTVHDSSRHSSDRMQDSRHSSDRVRDFARHHSDRAQDSSRHHSDRVQDSSRHHSDRIQDFSRHSDRAQDSSRHHSDRAQDSSRHRPDRIQDSRDRSDKPPYPSRHSRSVVGGSVSSTRNDYHSVRPQDSTRHRHACPPGDDRLNYGSRTSKVDQFVDDSLRHSHSVVDHHQRQLEDYSVRGDSAVGDCSNLDWRTSQDCSVDNYPDKGYSRAQQRSSGSDQRQRSRDRHGFASSSRDKGSRSPDPRRNSRVQLC